MDNNPSIILFNNPSRDIKSLLIASENLDFRLINCESGSQLLEELNKGNVLSIIVACGSDEVATSNLRVFLNESSPVLIPEDSRLYIIYSLETATTPSNWPGALDPRSVVNINNRTLQLFNDKNWENTILELRNLKKSVNLDTFKIRRQVNVEVKRNDALPFPSEAKALLRSAFNEMSKIEVIFPNQGFSKSLVLEIQPYDMSGKRMKLRFFAKVFDSEENAWQEYNNWRLYAYEKMAHIHYPTYNINRTCFGRAYSVSINNLIDGPEGKTTTFRDIINSTKNRKYNKIIEDFLSSTLEALDYWNHSIKQGYVDLVYQYLKDVLRNPEKIRKLESEIFASKYLGNHFDGLSLDERIKHYLPSAALNGTKIKICHGDLHSDNLMVHDYKGKYIPVLIDYSHTNPSSHCIVDHVTLETDLIINEVDINDINFLLSNLIYPPEKILATNSKMKRSKTQQIICIINKLRIDAFDKYKMSEIEYIGAAFLKTLQLLSHADFPDENVTKAHIYINHLLKRINLL